MGEAYDSVSEKPKYARSFAIARFDERIPLVGFRCSGGRFGGLFFGSDADVAARLAFVFEEDEAGDQGKEGVVLRARDILAGLVTRAALADEDGAAIDELATKALDAEPLPVGITSVCR